MIFDVLSNLRIVRTNVKMSVAIGALNHLHHRGRKLYS